MALIQKNHKTNRIHFHLDKISYNTEKVGW